MAYQASSKRETGVKFACPVCRLSFGKKKKFKTHADATGHFKYTPNSLFKRYRVKQEQYKKSEIIKSRADNVPVSTATVTAAVTVLYEPILMLQQVVCFNSLRNDVILMVYDFNQYFTLQMLNDQYCNHSNCFCDMVVAGCVEKTLNFCFQARKNGLKEKCIEVIGAMDSCFKFLEVGPDKAVMAVLCATQLNGFRVLFNERFPLFSALYDGLAYGDDCVMYLQVPCQVSICFEIVPGCELIFMSVSTLLIGISAVVERSLGGKVMCQFMIITRVYPIQQQEEIVSRSLVDPRPGYILQRMVRQNLFQKGTAARSLTSGKKMTKNFVVEFSGQSCAHLDDCRCCLVIRGISPKTIGFLAEAGKGTITEKFNELVAAINRFDWKFRVQKKAVCPADELKVRQWMLHDSSCDEFMVPVQFRDGICIPKFYGGSLASSVVNDDCDVELECHMSMTRMCEQLGIKQDLIGKNKSVVPSLVYCCLRAICFRAY